ncbi:MAG: magnesium transporter MgtE [Deltaproteobacteria bacterium HGW-Deltaproteobacteria-8]|jgi:CBS domain-containing protein|nr:MAG: magnesium transporter MgtE [Deltaproteobacteria bacterium HGW-Deltaproteobacteria-8]
MRQLDDGLFLSAVLDRPVISLSGQEIGRLWDVAMSPGEPLPQVKHLLVRKAGNIRRVPWADIALFNPVVVSLKGELQGAGDVPELEDEVLMRRDILDKQIVDVDGARVVRVNDLKLKPMLDDLCLAAVDVGFRGVLRRLGYLKAWDLMGGMLHRPLARKEIDWLFVQPLGANLSRLTLTVTRDKLSDLHPADLAHIIAQLPHQNVSAVLNSLDMDVAGEALGEMEPEDSSRVLSQLENAHAADVLEEMPPDEAADLLAEYSDEKAQELLSYMDPEDAEKVQELLEHEDDSAGGLMNNEYLFVMPDATVDDAMAQVRLLAAEVDNIYYVYVVDEGEQLHGVLSLKRLLLTAGETPVAEVMSRNPKSVHVDSSLDEVFELVVQYKLAALPVLEEDGKMAGIVSADDIMEHFLPFALRWKQYKSLRKF